MKQGDSVPVTIAGQVVAQASVKSLEEGKVTLVVPATLVVMATRTELAYEPEPQAEAPTGGAEHVILGVEENNVTVDVPVKETPAEAAVASPEETPLVEPAIKEVAVEAAVELKPSDSVDTAPETPDGE